MSSINRNFNSLFLKNQFRRIIKNTDFGNIIFFFPKYNFGGGEVVHLNILKIFKDYKTTCFITNQEEGKKITNEFKLYSNVVNLSRFALKYECFAKLIAKEINKKENAIVFGSNTIFFYKIIPFLKNNVKVIDLSHAFSYEHSNAIEIKSLPYIKRINKRIVLGNKTKNDFKNLYLKNNIDLKELDKFLVIKNKVDTPNTYLTKPISKVLNILFVGRSSSEKRPELFVELARHCQSLDYNFKFTLVGDFEKKESLPNNLCITGKIDDKIKLNNIYHNHDVILCLSTREGLPLVLLEAMAYGVIPISTVIGEISDLINKENKNGFIIEDESIKEWFVKKRQNKLYNKWKTNYKYQCNELEIIFLEKVISKLLLLQQNKELKNLISKNAYESVKREHSEERNTKAYFDLFFNHSI